MSWGSLSTKDESRFCEFIWRLTMWHITFVTAKTHPSRTSHSNCSKASNRLTLGVWLDSIILLLRKDTWSRWRCKKWWPKGHTNCCLRCPLPWINIYIYVYVHIYIYVYVHIYIYKYMISVWYVYVCMYVWMDGWMDGWMDAWMYVCMYVCVFVCLYICVFVCLYACMFVSYIFNIVYIYISINAAIQYMYIYM